jgi:hypothetical protein
MVLLALLSLAASPVQDGAVPYGTRVYAPPVVRPFEPPSGFGRVTAEGDGGGDSARRPIVQPVAVEAYLGSYEYAPSTAEASYNQGVAQAERNMDGRMGPLDGRWRVKDASGSVVLSLVLTDPGEAASLEGAWRKDGGRPGIGIIERASRSDNELALVWSEGGLTLRKSGDGWAGELTENGQTQSVTLTR